MKFWKDLSLTGKIVLVVILVLVVKSIINDYTILKLREKLNLIEVKVYQDSVKSKQLEVKKIISNNKQRTKIVYKKSKEIDLKKTQDEKDINNSDITDDDIKRFITNYKR